MNPDMTTPARFLIAAATVAVFWLDLQTPVGVAGWQLYFAPLLAALWLLPRRETLILAGVLPILLTLSFLYSPPGLEPGTALVNRMLGTVAFWLLVGLDQYRRGSLELRQERDDLGRQVRQLTAELERTHAALKTELAERGRIEESLRAACRALDRLTGRGAPDEEAQGSWPIEPPGTGPER